jgi:hypothetical protein
MTKQDKRETMMTVLHAFPNSTAMANQLAYLQISTFSHGQT